MQKEETYENFPIKIALLSVIFTIATYGIGTYIILGFGIVWAVLYAIYCVIIEIVIMKKSCTGCYYYGKVCGLGKGKLAAKLFKKGDSQKFIDSEVSWIQILPDLLTLILPIGAAIALLIINFQGNLIILVFLIILIVLYLIGNALIRENLTCKYCKQRELGCPAAKLFMEHQEKTA
jgi:hypothetical protein